MNVNIRRYKFTFVCGRVCMSACMNRLIEMYIHTQIHVYEYAIGFHISCILHLANLTYQAHPLFLCLVTLSYCSHLKHTLPQEREEESWRKYRVCKECENCIHSLPYCLGVKSISLHVRYFILHNHSLFCYKGKYFFHLNRFPMSKKGRMNRCLGGWRWLHYSRQR